MAIVFKLFHWLIHGILLNPVVWLVALFGAGLYVAYRSLVQSRDKGFYLPWLIASFLVWGLALLGPLPLRFLGYFGIALLLLLGLVLLMKTPLHRFNAGTVVLAAWGFFLLVLPLALRQPLWLGEPWLWIGALALALVLGWQILPRWGVPSPERPATRQITPSSPVLAVPSPEVEAPVTQVAAPATAGGNALSSAEPPVAVAAPPGASRVSRPPGGGRAVPGDGPRPRLAELRERRSWVWLRVWVPAVLLAIAGFGVAFLFVEPATPDRLAIATGPEGSTSHYFAGRYRRALEAYGLTLTLVEGESSDAHLQALREGTVDIALVPGGVGSAPEQGTSLLSLGSVVPEPVWLFQPRAATATRLDQLVGRRIAAGPAGGGSLTVAEQLLAANGATEERGTQLMELAAEDLEKALGEGEADLVIVVEPPGAPVVQKLLNDPQVAPLYIERSAAYPRRFPYLSALTLHEGAMGLAGNIPPRDLPLLATTMAVVVPGDFPSALVAPLLEVMGHVHDGGGPLHEAGEFPPPRYTAFDVHPAALDYYRNGPSWLQRVLPFWALELLDRFKVMVLPFLLLLMPVVRLLPPVYAMHIKRQLFRWYKKLRLIEERHQRARVNGESTVYLLGLLDELEREVEGVRVPLDYEESYYILRQSITWLRQVIGVSPLATSPPPPIAAVAPVDP
ncbi:MAG: TAXI family TRAP transporter solute-binding subunit [Candidatus Competibacterales bacterium]